MRLIGVLGAALALLAPTGGALAMTTAQLCAVARQRGDATLTKEFCAPAPRPKPHQSAKAPREHVRPSAPDLSVARPSPPDLSVADAVAHGDTAWTAKDYPLALTWYRQAAAQGQKLAELRIGYAYAHGLGVPQDYAQAMSWYQRAAAHGSTPAEYNIGLLYEKGRGVTHDESQARIWFQRAATGGNLSAQQWLAQHPS